MKKLKSEMKMAVAATCLLATSFINAPVFAGEFMHHGTSCMTANLLQGQLFTWNKDGLTNGFSNDLFVICPVTLDQNDWDATPSLNVEVEIFMPPNYTNAFNGGSAGPRCLVRFGQADGGTPPTDDIPFSFNEIIIVGTFDGDATDGDVDDGNTTLAPVSTGANYTAHILCLVPEGGTLIRYTARQQ